MLGFKQKTRLGGVERGTPLTFSTFGGSARSAGPPREHVSCAVVNPPRERHCAPFFCGNKNRRKKEEMEHCPLLCKV